jgi:hypothetical protein
LRPAAGAGKSRWLCSQSHHSHPRHHFAMKYLHRYAYETAR